MQINKIAVAGTGALLAGVPGVIVGGIIGAVASAFAGSKSDKK